MSKIDREILERVPAVQRQLIVREYLNLLDAIAETEARIEDMHGPHGDRCWTSTKALEEKNVRRRERVCQLEAKIRARGLHIGPKMSAGRRA